MEIDGADPNVNDDVGRLMQAYVNEKCAPHILPYEQQLAGIIVELVGLQVCAAVRARPPAPRPPAPTPPLPLHPFAPF